MNPGFEPLRAYAGLELAVAARPAGRALAAARAFVRRDGRTELGCAVIHAVNLVGAQAFRNRRAPVEVLRERTLAAEALAVAVLAGCDRRGGRVWTVAERPIAICGRAQPCVSDTRRSCHGPECEWRWRTLAKGVAREASGCVGLRPAHRLLVEEVGWKMYAVDPGCCSPAAGVTVDGERLLGVREVVGISEGGRGRDAHACLIVLWVKLAL